MAGLYETAIDALCTRTVDGHLVRPKIVASTATVRRAEDQIRALFTRSGRGGVPAARAGSPDVLLRAHVCARDERRAACISGLRRRDGRSKVVLLRTYLALLAAAQKAGTRPAAPRTTKNPADPYMTLVGYFNSLRELGGIRRIVEDEVASQVTVRSERRRVAKQQGSFREPDDRARGLRADVARADRQGLRHEAAAGASGSWKRRSRRSASTSRSRRT